MRQKKYQEGAAWPPSVFSAWSERFLGGVFVIGAGFHHLCSAYKANKLCGVYMCRCWQQHRMTWLWMTDIYFCNDESELCRDAPDHTPLTTERGAPLAAAGRRRHGADQRLQRHYSWLWTTLTDTKEISSKRFSFLACFKKRKLTLLMKTFIYKGLLRPLLCL